MTAATDVVVVGAGPTGLTLAAQLQQFGVNVRLIDRQFDRAHESRALVMQPRTLEVLGGLGVGQTLIERGHDAVQLHLHFGKREIALRLFETGLEDTAYPFLLFIAQAETEAVLTEYLAAQHVQVERGGELLGFTTGDDAVTCTLRDQHGREEQVHARYLIGCDGARSTVRHAAGIPFEGGAYRQTFVLADLEVDGELEPDSCHAFLGAEGMLFFFPLGRPATWRMQSLRPPTAVEATNLVANEPSLAELQAICDRFTGGGLRLRDPVWTTYFRLHHRQATRYRACRIFLAGDAAHVHSPAGAQGMNTGIQDAWNLGWKLALVVRGLADEKLLDSYERERWPVGRSVLRLTDRASKIAISDRRFVRLMRTQVAPRLLPQLLRFRQTRTLGFRQISQLAISYPKSPAVEEGEPALSHGPKAGDRLPDARLTRDREPIWLQEALAAPACHLLLCGSTEAWDDEQIAKLAGRYADVLAVHRLSREAGTGVLHDRDGHVSARLGVEQAAQYLVRPDGHIGYRSGGTDLRHLERYLDRWFPGDRSPTGQEV